MIKKEITSFEEKIIIACDENCEKAWGINARPKVQLDESNSDDYYFLADEELGIAPKEPGTYEGGHGKPKSKNGRLNKWCFRECERCYISNSGNSAYEHEKSNFTKRVYNIPGNHKKQN